MLGLWHVRVALFEVFEGVRVVRYYGRPRFFFVDMLLKLFYLFDTPYRVCKRHLEARGEKEVYTYGETPLVAMDVIARKCRLLSSDVVYECGAGRGRGAFWLACFVGCTVVALEEVAAFIERGNRVKRYSALHNIRFEEGDFLKADFRRATVLYIYGRASLFTPPLLKALSTAKRGTKIITVSFPLADLGEHLPFEHISTFQATYPWGKADVFLQKKI